MDFWGIFMFFLLTFLIMSCCGYCCTTKRRGAILSTPVVVTSATHTAPGGYPVTQLPPQGFQTNLYAPPYNGQPGVTVQMPMPMPMPINQSTGAPVGMPQTYVAPYPVAQPAMTSGGNMSPPSYDIAVAGAGAGQAHPAHYEKQAPYNPNY